MQEVLTVSELTLSIKKHLESRFSLLCVRGEISNFKEQASGHIYFTLKDPEAQMSAVLFRGVAQKLKKIPKSGDQVILQGELSLYMPRGNYQLIVKELQFVGVGEMLLRFHALKDKLQARGWFDPARKKTLPKYPKTIGVVTSSTGAVIQDIIHVLSRRFSGFHLILNPVKVQGEGAASEIADAIYAFNRYLLADVLIIGRGGGSFEDLAAFNEESVAQAIFDSKIPVISAVGHESDFSIADFVADVRAPTPSAAAEIATSLKSAELKLLKNTSLQLYLATKNIFQLHKTHLQHFLKEPFFSKATPLLITYYQKLSTLEEEIEEEIDQFFVQKKQSLTAFQQYLHTLSPLTQLRTLQQRLDSLNNLLNIAGHRLLGQIRSLYPKSSPFDLKMTQNLEEKHQRLHALQAHLQGIDPKNLLKRGYCILFQENKDSVILSARDLSLGDRVSIQFHDGAAHAQVDKVII